MAVTVLGEPVRGAEKPWKREGAWETESTGAGWQVLRVVIGLALVPLAIAVCRGLAHGHAKATAPAVGRQG